MNLDAAKRSVSSHSCLLSHQVSDAILEALATENQFLVYTDSLSRSIGHEYRHFADTVIESVTRPTTVNTNPAEQDMATKQA